MLQEILKLTEKRQPGAKLTRGPVTTPPAEGVLLHLVTKVRFLQVTSRVFHHHRLYCQMEMYVHKFSGDRLQFYHFHRKTIPPNYIHFTTNPIPL